MIVVDFYPLIVVLKCNVVAQDIILLDIEGILRVFNLQLK